MCLMWSCNTKKVRNDDSCDFLPKWSCVCLLAPTNNAIILNHLSVQIFSTMKIVGITWYTPHPTWLQPPPPPPPPPPHTHTHTYTHKIEVKFASISASHIHKYMEQTVFRRTRWIMILKPSRIIIPLDMCEISCRRTLLMIIKNWFR